MRPFTDDLNLAPITLRAAAAALDAAIVVILLMMVGSLGMSSGVSLGSLVPVIIGLTATYHIGFLAVAGATPGKTAMGLHVVDREGGRPKLDTAILRYLTYFAFGVGFPFGTIANVASMVADEHRRTFPDRLAGTLVLQTRGEEV
jgi:uncharacterized RDD family membrane protein YckC